MVKQSEQFSLAPADLRQLEQILVKTSGVNMDTLQARERRWMLYAWLVWVAGVAGLCGLVIFIGAWPVP